MSTAPKGSVKEKVLSDPDNKLNPDDLRLIYDEKGNLVGMGQVDNTFEIRHKKTHIVKDVDSLDLQFMDEILETKEIRDWLKPLDKKSRFFKEAFENVFLLLFKPDPDLESFPSLSQQFMMQLLVSIMSEEEFRELAKRCAMSTARSAAGAKEIVNVLASMVSEEDLAQLNAMEAVGDDMQDILDEMRQMVQDHSCGQAQEGETDSAGQPKEGSGDGQQCAECGKKHPQLRPKTAAELGLSAEEARERLRKISQKLKGIREKFKKVAEKHKDKLNEAMGQAASVGTPKASKMTKKIDDVANSFGLDPGQLGKIPPEEILKLSERYNNDRQLKELLDQLGRMSRIARKALSALKKPVDNVQLEPMTLDADLGRLMPHEVVASRHEKLRPDFKKRFLEGEVECFETEGEETVHRGPIIVCKDTSGSMSGPPNTWASALYLAMAAVAAKQRRESVLINFSSPGEVRVTEFKLGEKFTKYIEEATYMFNGGTCFETPLNLSLDFIKKSAWNKADVLFITDGLCDVSPKFLTEFNATKAAREFKVITILINMMPTDVGVVESFSDTVKFLSDIQKDEDVLNTAFAI